jgi:hypothetical protein
MESFGDSQDGLNQPGDRAVMPGVRKLNERAS